MYYTHRVHGVTDRAYNTPRNDYLGNIEPFRARRNGEALRTLQSSICSVCLARRSSRTTPSDSQKEGPRSLGFHRASSCTNTARETQSFTPSRRKHITRLVQLQRRYPVAHFSHLLLPRHDVQAFRLSIHAALTSQRTETAQEAYASQGQEGCRTHHFHPPSCPSPKPFCLPTW